MTRYANTTAHGNSFGQNLVNTVWNKGRTIPDFDSNIWRYDVCGIPMKYSDYGNTNSKHGWEVDHIVPVDQGGGDQIGNLQPLQWQNNRKKGNNYPWHC